jgi:hypothetical protein
MEMKRFIILLDSRLRGNDGSSGFPLPRLRGHMFRGNDIRLEPILYINSVLKNVMNILRECFFKVPDLYLSFFGLSFVRNFKVIKKSP